MATSVYVHENGETRPADRVEPEWLAPGSTVTVWVDLVAPTPEEARILTDVFDFHPLAVEDAMSAIHHPKIETYDNYLYLILHGIDFEEEHHWFATLDQSGVGQLVEVAVTKGRRGRPGIKLGICGEHGGDPASIRFFEKVGLDYVSCSPYRVPVARLAAAQAGLAVKDGD